MAKKRSGQKKKTKPQNARDIQTPAPTEGGSEPESPNAETSNSQARQSGSNGKVKAPVRRPRFERSPTRDGDYAPNAGDYDSNDQTDIDLPDASEQSSLVEDRPSPLSRWVKEVIQSETSAHSETMVQEFFTADEPDYARCAQFFQSLNQKIRGANAENKAADIDAGVVPESTYNELCRAWQQEYNAAGQESPDLFWDAFNMTRKLLNQFNKRHYLPKMWNISQEWAEQKIGSPNPKVEESESDGSTSGQDYDQTAPDSPLSASEESNTDSDSAGDSGPTGLDALEARSIKQQRELTSAKVLFWWPKGNGSQIFVRYGDRSTPIYRIRAGSHESYNPSRVERVLTTNSRGAAKRVGSRNGLPEEFWKYSRKDVEDIIGIGWKVEQDDENGIDAIDLLLPSKGATYPQTRIMVRWKDGVVTLEGRSFIRRITSGSGLEGDRLIYQKAYELEAPYRTKHGLTELEDDDSDDDDAGSEASDSPVWRNQIRGRRRSEPTRKQLHGKTKKLLGTNPGSDTESDTSAEYPINRYRRYRSEPVRYPPPVTQRRPATSRDSRAEIKMLERRIQRLKMEMSASPQGRRESQPTQRRNTRGRAN